MPWSSHVLISLNYHVGCHSSTVLIPTENYPVQVEAWLARIQALDEDSKPWAVAGSPSRPMLGDPFVTSLLISPAHRIITFY